MEAQRIIHTLIQEQPPVFEMRMVGNGVKPQGLKAREVADLIKNLEESLYHIISGQNPEVNKDEIFISLIQVKDESAGFGFTPNILSVMLNGFLLLANAIESDNYTEIPIKSILSIREIQKFAQKKRCNTEFKVNAELKATLNYSKSIEIPKSAYIKGYTTIYPYIKRIGGSTPKVAMRINPNDPFIYVETNEENAKKLGTRLYSTVGMTGMATWERVTKQLVDFKIDQILDYRETSIGDAFLVLRNELGNYWDNTNNVDDFLN